MSILHISGLWSLSRDVVKTLAELVSRTDWRVEALVITGVSRTGTDYSHCCYLVHLLQKAFELVPNRLIILPAAGDLVARSNFNRDCHVPILRRPYRPDQPSMLDLDKCFLGAWDTEALWRDGETWRVCSRLILKACPEGKHGLLISNRAMEIWKPDSLKIISERLQELTCDPACSSGRCGDWRIATPAGSLRLLRASGTPARFESALHMVLPSGGAVFSRGRLAGPAGRGGGVSSRFSHRLHWSNISLRSASFPDLLRPN